MNKSDTNIGKLRLHYKNLTGQDMPSHVTNREDAMTVIQAAMSGADAVTSAAEEKASHAKAEQAVSRVVSPVIGAPPVIDVPADLVSKFIPKKDDDMSAFVPREPYYGILKLLHKHRISALLNGEAGVGKTTMGKALAFEENLPWLLISMDNMLSIRELFGQINIKDATSGWTPGVFTLLTQVPSVIHIAEANASDSGKNFILHEILCNRRFYVKEANGGAGQVFYLHPECYILLDGNPPGARYSGANQYNIAFLDRPAVINIPVWNEHDIKMFISGDVKPSGTALKLSKQSVNPDQIASFYHQVSDIISSNKFRAMISLRGVKRLMSLLELGVPLKTALEVSVLNHLRLGGGQDPHVAATTIAKSIWNV
jgi:hypothetical protein